MLIENCKVGIWDINVKTGDCGLPVSAESDPERPLCNYHYNRFLDEEAHCAAGEWLVRKYRDRRLKF